MFYTLNVIQGKELMKYTLVCVLSAAPVRGRHSGSPSVVHVLICHRASGVKKLSEAFIWGLGPAVNMHSPVHPVWDSNPQSWDQESYALPTEQAGNPI